jgi:hypothetical protein
MNMDIISVEGAQSKGRSPNDHVLGRSKLSVGRSQMTVDACPPPLQLTLSHGYVH